MEIGNGDRSLHKSCMGRDDLDLTIILFTNRTMSLLFMSTVKKKWEREQQSTQCIVRVKYLF